jgi:hypothetical protein
MSDDGPQDDFIAATSPSKTSHIILEILEILVMGYVICNALATFSRLMNHVLEPYINNFVIVYLDDICIYYETPE